MKWNEIANHTSWNILNKLVCGETSSDRIIGGNNAALGQFPWIVRLGYVGKFIEITTRSHKALC